MKKVMVVFGTRPEAIKMCPVIKELKTKDLFDVVVCVTGQHRQMLDQVLNAFDVTPNYDLCVMESNQTLFSITINILNGIKNILEIENPNLVLVHGDTSTTFVTSLACFYLQIPVGHVEAGLRTNNIYSPFPEEFNRQAVSILSRLHFAPTKKSKENLIKEGKDATNIFVTGNTAIDTLRTTVTNDYTSELLDWARGSKLIILTAHRRENLGDIMANMFKSIKKVVDEFPDVKILYPIHMNPVIKELAYDVFSDNERIRIIEPLDVIDFHNLLARSYFVLTDSGGIQEEAPFLKKPVLVMRDVTERTEAIEAGTIKLIGTDGDSIFNNCKNLLTNIDEYDKMVNAINPYGDGYASKYIVEILENFFQ